jgi:hypothetical protein
MATTTAATTTARGPADDALVLAPPLPPPPLFVLSHTNRAPARLDKEQEQEPQPATPDEEEEEDREGDLSRAGMLLGRVDTPALVCYTEHGAVPYLTRGESLGQALGRPIPSQKPQKNAHHIPCTTIQTCCSSSSRGTRGPSACSSST